MDKFYIDMPDDFEIENQINSIVEKGIVEKESFYKHIKNMYQSIGFKNLFHDMSELIFIGVLSLSILILMAINVTRNIYMDKEKIYTFIFIISPLFYFITNVFSYINMKENNTYQIEMVCKYNVFQISSLRILVFSTTCILANIIMLIVISKKILFLKGIMISITSLFLFSTVFLFFMLKIRNMIMKWVVITGWIVLNGTLYIMNVDIYNRIIMNTPTYVYAIVSASCIYLYLKNIKSLLLYKNLSLEI